MGCPGRFQVLSLSKLPLQAASCYWSAAQNRGFYSEDFCLFVLSALVRISPQFRHGWHESRHNFSIIPPCLPHFLMDGGLWRNYCMEFRHRLPESFKNSAILPHYSAILLFFPMSGGFTVECWRNLAELFRWKLGLKRKNFITIPSYILMNPPSR
jgi:hypothetical protein